MANAKRTTDKQLKTWVDELGTVRAQLADLKDQEAKIRGNLIEIGLGAIEGELFRATVSFSDRTLIDWQAIAEKFDPSRQLVRAHTRRQPVTIVRTSTRRGGAHA